MILNRDEIVPNIRIYIVSNPDRHIFGVFVLRHHILILYLCLIKLNCLVGELCLEKRRLVFNCNFEAELFFRGLLHAVIDFTSNIVKANICVAQRLKLNRVVLGRRVQLSLRVNKAGL